LERNDLIAWAVATAVWLAVLGLLLWLASRERRGGGPWLRWLGPRIAVGVVLWIAVFGATRWAERTLGLRSESHARAVRSIGPHSGSKAP
jgi:peptidoglycan/LPS O-acetylase OafA/YrhL